MKSDHETLMMGTEMVSETSVIFKQLTLLIAREDFMQEYFIYKFLYVQR
jgi:hypothetical protein